MFVGAGRRWTANKVAVGAKQGLGRRGQRQERQCWWEKSTTNWSVAISSEFERVKVCIVNGSEALTGRARGVPQTDGMHATAADQRYLEYLVMKCVEFH